MERETLESDAQMRAARERFVAAVRAASAAGMSQREIALHSGRSQAEVNRLLRFHGTSPVARRLRARRGELARLLAARGVGGARVFGSVAHGTDDYGSDIDLLVTALVPMGLLARAGLEAEVSELLGAPVDLVFDDSIRPDLRDHIVGEAVPL